MAVLVSEDSRSDHDCEQVQLGAVASSWTLTENRHASPPVAPCGARIVVRSKQFALSMTLEQVDRIRPPVWCLSTSKCPRASSFARKTKDDFRRMRCLPLPESHTKIISVCSDGASPNSTALIVRGPTPGERAGHSPCATTRARTYRQSSRTGGRALTNMVEVLNPAVREPWQKLKEYFMN